MNKRDRIIRMLVELTVDEGAVTRKIESQRTTIQRGPREGPFGHGTSLVGPHVR
jgi:hypothetical protein